MVGVDYGGRRVGGDLSREEWSSREGEEQSKSLSGLERADEPTNHHARQFSLSAHKGSGNLPLILMG
jgi:hypothetical protein